MIATYIDAGAIMIFFLGSYCTDHGGVGDIFASITGDVFVIDDKKRIRTFDALTTSIWYFSYTLAEAFRFVGEGLVPNFGVIGMVVQWMVL